MGKHLGAERPAAAHGYTGRHTGPIATRRTFVITSTIAVLGAGAATATAVGMQQETAGAAAKKSAATGNSGPAAPARRAAVLAAAEATVGTRLMGSAWSTYFSGYLGDWDAAFASWLLRGLNAPKTTNPRKLYSWLSNRGSITTKPEAGSLIFYLSGSARIATHVGFVDSVTRGVPQTIEGGLPLNIDPKERFVRRFSAPWSSAVLFGNPPYAG